MAGDLSDFVAQLSPYGQIAANLVAGVGIGAFGVWQYVSQRRAAKAAVQEKAPPAAIEPPADLEHLLDSASFGRLLTALETIAAHMVIHSEALRTISAATTVWAKDREGDFEEWRIWRAVEARFDELMRRRGSGPPTGGSWGA